MAEWSSFHCKDPDFVVKSVPDNITFAVNRISMSASEIFRMIYISRQKPASNLVNNRGHVLVLRRQPI